jgi:hypothetical protein
MKQDTMGRDWSTAKVMMETKDGDHKFSLNYCDGVGTGGIAITPTAGQMTGGQMPKFADVRQCQPGGAFDGKCQGLTGCGGLSGEACPSGISCAYTKCSGGYSYLGKDKTIGDPSTNCPNVYTLSRQSTATKCTVDNYDKSSLTAYMKTVDTMTIPEGAWVTGYWSSVLQWQGESGICSGADADQQGITKYVVQMGCAKSSQGGNVNVMGFATTYSMLDGKMTMLETKGDPIPLGNNTTSTAVHTSSYIIGTVTTVDGVTKCKFTGLNSVVTGDNTTKSGESYMGFTFGFMPGYYSDTCTTSIGACST